MGLFTRLQDQNGPTYYGGEELLYRKGFAKSGSWELNTCVLILWLRKKSELP